MKRFYAIALLLLAFCLPAGCKAQTPPPGELVVELKAFPSKDYCELTLIATNKREEPMELHFNSAQQHDFIAKDAQGRVVWRWGEDQMFTQALSQKTLAPGESYEIQEQWDYKRIGSARVEAGRYLITGMVMAEPGRVESEPVEIQVPGEISPTAE